jgi:hypothetical protein
MVDITEKTPEHISSGKTMEEIIREAEKHLGKDFYIREEEMDLGPDVGEERWYDHSREAK